MRRLTLTVTTTICWLSEMSRGIFPCGLIWFPPEIRVLSLDGIQKTPVIFHFEMPFAACYMLTWELRDLWGNEWHQHKPFVIITVKITGENVHISVTIEGRLTCSPLQVHGTFCSKPRPLSSCAGHEAEGSGHGSQSNPDGGPSLFNPSSRTRGIEVKDVSKKARSWESRREVTHY